MSGLEAFGVIASVAALVKLGASLSCTLFTISHGYGAAASELGDIAFDISIFSATLKQLACALKAEENPGCHLITNVENIVQRCQQLFDHIDLLLGDLRNQGTKTMDKLDVVRKMRWHFRKPQVQLIRGTLDSFKTTLSLMLATLDLVRKSSLTNSTAFDDEGHIQHDRMLVKSLIMAEKLSIANLQRLEVQAEDGGSNTIPVPQQDGTTQYIYRSNEALHRPRFSQSSSYLSNIACLDNESLTSREVEVMRSSRHSEYLPPSTECTITGDIEKAKLKFEDSLVSQRGSIQTYLDVSEDDDVPPAYVATDQASVHSLSTTLSRDAESTMDRLLQKWGNQTEKTPIDTTVPCPQVLVDAGYPSFTGQERVMLRAAFGDLYTFCKTWHKKTSGRFHKPFKSEDWEWKLHTVGQLVFGELGFMGKLTRDLKHLDDLKESLLTRNEGLAARVDQLERINCDLTRSIDILMKKAADCPNEEVTIATENECVVESSTRDKKTLQQQLQITQIECDQQHVLYDAAEASINSHHDLTGPLKDPIMETHKVHIVNVFDMKDTPPASSELHERTSRPDLPRIGEGHSWGSISMILPSGPDRVQAWTGEMYSASSERNDSTLCSLPINIERNMIMPDVDRSPNDYCFSLPAGTGNLQGWAEDLQLSMERLNIDDTTVV